MIDDDDDGIGDLKSYCPDDLTFLTKDEVLAIIQGEARPIGDEDEEFEVLHNGVWKLFGRMDLMDEVRSHVLGEHPAEVDPEDVWCGAFSDDMVLVVDSWSDG